MCAEIIDGFDDSPDYSKMVFQNSDIAHIPVRSVFQKLDVVRIISRKTRFGIEFFLSREKKNGFGNLLVQNRPCHRVSLGVSFVEERVQVGQQRVADVQVVL